MSGTNQAASLNLASNSGKISAPAIRSSAPVPSPETSEHSYSPEALKKLSLSRNIEVAISDREAKIANKEWGAFGAVQV